MEEADIDEEFGCAEGRAMDVGDRGGELGFLGGG